MALAKAAERRSVRTRRQPVEISDEVAAELGRRVSALGARLQLGTEDLLAALEAVATSTPAGAQRPADALSPAEEAVLREAGSLRRPLPELTERASFRTQLVLEQVLREALTVKEVAQRLGVSESRVRQRIAARTLLAVERAGTWKLPAFQLDGGADLAEVLPAFPPDAHPAAVLLFLDAPASELELDGQALTPREWLVSGGPASRVVELVELAYSLP